MNHTIDTDYCKLQVEVDSDRPESYVRGVLEMYVAAALQHLSAPKELQDTFDLRLMDLIKSNAQDTGQYQLVLDGIITKMDGQDDE